MWANILTAPAGEFVGSWVFSLAMGREEIFGSGGVQLSSAGPVGYKRHFWVPKRGRLSPPFPPQPPPLTSASAAASWSTRSRPKTSATACRGTRAAASPGTTAGASGPTAAGPSSSCGSLGPRARRYPLGSSVPPGPCPGGARTAPCRRPPPSHRFPAGTSLLSLQDQAFRSRFAESMCIWAFNYSNIHKYNNLIIIIRLGAGLG